jgi:pimeloyl-ACP methyl ester carboxylesterase
MRQRLRSSALWLSLVFPGVLVACGGNDSRAPAPAPSATGAVSTAPTVRSRNNAYQTVRLHARDGAPLVGRLWGSGEVAVVLAHGFSPATGQDDWLPFAETVARRGYMVVSFNFRGFCDAQDCSGGGMEPGETWRDASAAVAFARKRGAQKVFVVGASMGGLAVLRLAAMPGADLAGVVSLSTPQYPAKYYQGELPANDVTPNRLRQIEEPKLFVAGKDDIQFPGGAPLRPGIDQVRFADDARRMYAAADEPKQLLLVESRFHSSQLVGGYEDDAVIRTRRVIFSFLEAN